MLRRQARLRREFIYKKSIEARDAKVHEKKQMVKAAIADLRLPKNLAAEAAKINEDIDFDDEGGDGPRQSVDDEYYWAGVEDPKIVVTTSCDPSSKLQQFAKELRFLFPNATKINRGNYVCDDLVQACLADQATDLVVVNETRGVPDALIISHLPFGPTVKFTLHNVLMRHDMDMRSEKRGSHPARGDGEEPSGSRKMPQQFPHLVFTGLNTQLGQRVRSVLKHLFPVPKEDARRVCMFSEQDDLMVFRHYTYKWVEKAIEVDEHGPRFEMTLYKIWRGSLNQEDIADVEWVLRPFTNTARKRRVLSTAADT